MTRPDRTTLQTTFAALCLGLAVAACGDSGGSGGTGGATCSDGITNGEEVDVDCGGPDCAACANGRACEEAGDCLSGLCEGGQCVAAPTCRDRQLNGDETDVDCGGSCDPCEVGLSCGGDDDCDTGVCEGGRCEEASCTDGRANARETDVDCGGPDCAVCSEGEGCEIGQDCDSGSCVEGACAAPSCDDGVLNGDELDVDCGGSCGGCPVGTECTEDAQCESGVCSVVRGECVAASCGDGRLNQDESDVDCGGTACDPCPNGAGCNEAADCEDGICESNLCIAATCDDGSQNGRETDVDCGGPVCVPCPGDAGCERSRDCISSVCNVETLTCAAPACDDGIRNGTEADVDCGGDCGGCQVGQFCGKDDDCLSGVCNEVQTQCEPPSCRDATFNQDETDVDCGGATCGPCADGRNCLVDADCSSLKCNDTALTCDAATCDDGLQNGDEDGIDCGGSNCPICPDLIEDFETGSMPSRFTLTGGGGYNGSTYWLASTTNAIAGTYSALSDNVPSSGGFVRMTAEITTGGGGGTLSFDWRVSTENNFDWLDFYLDGTRLLHRSGSASGEFSTSVSEGDHTIYWEFNRDFCCDGGSNQVWVDEVLITNTVYQ
jgi:hypothetical protein